MFSSVYRREPVRRVLRAALPVPRSPSTSVVPPFLRPSHAIGRACAQLLRLVRTDASAPHALHSEDGQGGRGGRGQTAAVGAATAVGMFAAALVTSAAAPHLTLWQSHTVTIVVSTVLATVIAARALRHQARRRAHAADATARRASEDRFRALVEQSPDAVAIHAEGRLRFVNAAGAALLGAATPGALVGRAILDFVHPDDHARLGASLATIAATGRRADGRAAAAYRMVTADGHALEVEAATVPVVDGGEAAFQTVVRDVTTRSAAERAMRESEARYRVLFEASPLPMWVYDVQTLRFLAVNAAAVVQYGWSHDEFLTLALPDIRPAEDAAALAADVTAAPSGLKQASEWRHRTRTGGLIDVIITSHPLDFDGRAARLVLVTDVTERKAAEAALRRSEARYRALAQHASDVTLVVAADREAQVRDVSASVERQYGHAPEALVGQPLAAVLHPEDVAAVHDTLAALRARPGDAVTLRHRVRRADGTWRQTETIAVDLADEPAVGGVVLTTRDVTERAALEAELAHQAHHDALTGLPNRAKFRLQVAWALADAATAGRDPGDVAVLLLDLDGFKRVNDSAGHAVGDALLQHVAGRLQHATRGCDLVARLGGDEFAVLLDGVRTDADLTAVADRIVRALARPFTVDGTSCVVGASVGIARGMPAETAGPDAAEVGGVGPRATSVPAPTAAPRTHDGIAVAPVDALLRNADLALYEAKARGKGQYAFFAPAMHAAAVERVALEAALRRALDRDEFCLVYQPIVDLASGDVVGTEALVRWAHPERGLVSPAQFIPLAEESGLIVPLGRWVLGEACRQAAQWTAVPNAAARLGAGGVTVTVNVSGRQLARAEFVDEVAAALAASGLAPVRLTLELTESTVIHQPELALERLTALKALGVRLAIDDFGTGYSALSYLQRFPIDVLKIDKSFVDRVADGGQAAALASAIVALGRALSLRTVAEGVEHADQRAALAAMGCALGQGYLFARPLTPEAMDALLHGDRRTAVAA